LKLGALVESGWITGGAGFGRIHAGSHFERGDSCRRGRDRRTGSGREPTYTRRTAWGPLDCMGKLMRHQVIAAFRTPLPQTLMSFPTVNALASIARAARAAFRTRRDAHSTQVGGKRGSKMLAGDGCHPKASPPSYLPLLGDCKGHTGGFWRRNPRQLLSTFGGNRQRRGFAPADAFGKSAKVGRSLVPARH
jgi:hypothetical protein